MEQRLREVDSGFAWPCIARLAFTVAFAALMLYEWMIWPNGSAFLGPLGLIWYNGITVESTALCAASLALVFAFIIRPHVVTAGLSMLGVVNWVALGELAKGIGC
jgi:hypothetical protein